VALLGLSLGVVAAVAIGAALIALIRRASEENE
jgi:malonyl CoA-acyl carrier protein transacylase